MSDKKLPIVEISTIHQKKGGEADIVYVLTDIFQIVQEQIDNEMEEAEAHRVFFVAFTRAKEELHVIANMDTSEYHYEVIE